jgi:hypothetical protein
LYYIIPLLSEISYGDRSYLCSVQQQPVVDKQPIIAAVMKVAGSNVWLELIPSHNAVVISDIVIIMKSSVDRNDNHHITTYHHQPSSSRHYYVIANTPASQLAT